MSPRQRHPLGRSPGQLGLLLFLVWSLTPMMAAETSRTLYDFASTNAISGWQVVNDDVMGGVSRSRFTASTNGAAQFAGEVSLANNGGFASVRSPATPHDLRPFDAFVIRVRGDGQRYKFTARMDSSFDSPLYQASFTTRAGEWTEHRFRFAGLVPTFRGRVLTGVPAFAGARCTGVGFLISDRQAGPFALDIQWIQAAKSPEE